VGEKTVEASDREDPKLVERGRVNTEEPQGGSLQKTVGGEKGGDPPMGELP